MKILFIAILLISAVVRCADDAMPDTPWFDHVKRPTSISHPQLCELAKNLFAGLKEGKNVKQLASLAPLDNSPRVIFITVGDDNWPGRSYYGTGLSFSQAFETALDLLISNEPVFARETIKLAENTIGDIRKEGKVPPDEWLERVKNPNAMTWLRLDIVQAAKPTFGFTVEHSRLALTSLVGFAFGPELGFAFTPDQITGRCLLSDSGHIAKLQICNIISETYNWPALKSWMQISAVDQGHRICLFETDSYYSDASTACRLYRGHQLEAKIKTPEQYLEMACACADKLSLSFRGDGIFTPPVPTWVKSGKENESLDALAEYSIAMSRLAKAASKPDYNRLALAALRQLLSAIKPLTDNTSAVVEDETLPQESMQVPRKVALLRTNALACIALQELSRDTQNIPEDIDARTESIVRYLVAQAASSGGFHIGRLLKDKQLLTVDTRDHFAQVEDDALAILALAKFNRKKHYDKLAELIKKSMAELIEQRITKVPMDALSLSPWLVEAISFAERDDKEFTLTLIKLGYAATAGINMEPLYPDYFGTQKRRPSCTLSAELTWLIANVSNALRAIDKPTLAAEQLTSAIPGVIFQTQAFIGTPESSILPSPKAYRGLFRDNLEAYGFELSGQVAQILALTTFAQECKSSKWLNPRKAYAQLEKARADTDVHPGPLSVELVLTQKFDKTGDQRDLTGGLSRANNVRIRGNGGRIERPDSNINSGNKKVDRKPVKK